MSEKSALRLIAGKDALLEYAPQSYPVKTYVEYQGLVYKSITPTSNTFINSEWELIGDLRDVRVRTITDRNALTGSTPTSGTTGIHIPIIDNTNVLVLHAQGDPLVGADKFARYNYNKTTNTFLLLQVSTGSTGSNVSDYTLLTNKPSIISGITATAGAGLTGGAVLSGSVPPNRVSFSFAHADTSSQTNLTGTGYTYTQQLKLDTFGHVTGATSSTWVHPDTSSQANVNNSGFTYIQSLQVDGAGHLQSIGSSTWVHPDTSTQGSVTNTGSTVIQSIQVDGAGHVTGISSSVVSGGGGGINFNVAGDSGGGIAMPNTGTLRITGGTNIQTVSNIHGGNLGVRINALPSGSDGDVQINSGGAFSNGAGLTYFNTRLTTPDLNISTQPISGSSSLKFLQLNSTGGTRLVSQNAIAALPVNAVQYRTATGFGGNAQWLFDPSNIALTLGTRTGSTGSDSITIGTNNSANLRSIAVGAGNKIQSVNGGNAAFGSSNKIIGSGGGNSYAFGQLNILSGTTAGNMAFGNSNNVQGGYSMAFGSSNIVSGGNAIAIGTNNKSTGTTSYTQGDQNIAAAVNARATGILCQAIGYSSIAQNVVTLAAGYASFAGGLGIVGGFGGTRFVIASGQSSFNFSENNTSSIIGNGALANNSAILGGVNQHIASGNVRSAIIGGFGINLTGTTYIETVAVPSLAIFTTPSTGGSDDILTWNPISKKVGKITQASIIINAVVNVSSTQMLNSFTTPITIISAPGAGRIINVLSVSGSLTFGTVAYATNISAFFRYNGLSSPINSASWNIAQTSNKFVRFAIGSNGTGEDPSLIDNKSVTLSTQTGNPTAGDSTFKVYVTYQIVTL